MKMWAQIFIGVPLFVLAIFLAAEAAVALWGWSRIGAVCIGWLLFSGFVAFTTPDGVRHDDPTDDGP